MLQDGFTPLHWAGFYGHVTLIDMLVSHGANPLSQATDDRATPLHYAAEQGLVAAVLRLLLRHSDVNAVDKVHNICRYHYILLYDCCYKLLSYSS